MNFRNMKEGPQKAEKRTEIGSVTGIGVRTEIDIGTRIGVGIEIGISIGKGIVIAETIETEVIVARIDPMIMTVIVTETMIGTQLYSFSLAFIVT